MLFVLSKLLWAALRPSVLLLLAACGGLAARRRVPLAVALGGFATIAALPVENLVLRPLEDRFPPPAPPAAVAGILVLGGAVDDILSAGRDRPALNDAAERMTEAVALSRRYPDARVVFTGGSGRLFRAGMTEADAAGALFAALGLDPARLTLEPESRNTWDNAVLARAAARPAAGETWLLVTSAFHMPRAVGIFRRVGWPVLPWPVGYKTLPGTRGWFRASFPERLALIDLAAHEWVGLVAYRLLGRSSAFFPAPDHVPEQATESKP